MRSLPSLDSTQASPVHQPGQAGGDYGNDDVGGCHGHSTFKLAKKKTFSRTAGKKLRDVTAPGCAAADAKLLQPTTEDSAQASKMDDGNGDDERDNAVQKASSVDVVGRCAVPTIYSVGTIISISNMAWNTRDGKEPSKATAGTNSWEKKIGKFPEDFPENRPAGATEGKASCDPFGESCGVGAVDEARTPSTAATPAATSGLRLEVRDSTESSSVIGKILYRYCNTVVHFVYELPK